MSEATTIEQRTLDKTDRCDKCGPVARAYVRIVFENGSYLDFCGSCFTQREDFISTLEVTVVDERQFIASD